MKASSASGLCASVSVVMDEWVASLRFLCVLRVSAVRYAFFIAEDAESAGLLGGERGHQVVPVAGGGLPAALLVFLLGLPPGKEPALARLHRPGRPSLPLGMNRRLRPRGLTDEKRKEKTEKSKREFRVSRFEFRFSHWTVSSSAWGMGEAWWCTSRQSPLRSR